MERMNKGQIKAQLNLIRQNSPLGPLPIDTQNWILSLIEANPHFPYRPSEIESIGITKIYQYGKFEQNFQVTLINGEKQILSYKTFVATPNPQAEIKSAFRQSIAYQIRDYKDYIFSQYPHTICPFTGETLTRENGDADHREPTFAEILSEFMKREQLTAADIELIDLPVPPGGKGLASPELAARFQGFHLRKANLQVISRRGNQVIKTALERKL